MTREDARLTALITGASAGIGRAFAEVFAREGFDLVLTARRQGRLESLAAELSKRYGARVEVIAEDLADPEAPKRLIGEVEARGLRVDALVNSAGYIQQGTRLEDGWQAQRDFLQVMLLAPEELTARVLPGMVERRRGYILNVSSVMGLLPSGRDSLYSASKSYMIQSSLALHLEQRDHGVHVCAFCPGFTRTELFRAAGVRARGERLPGIFWMDAGRVAEEGYRALMAGKAMHVPGLFNQAIVWVAKYSPFWLLYWLTRQVARAQGRGRFPRKARV